MRAGGAPLPGLVRSQAALLAGPRPNNDCWLPLPRVDGTWDWAIVNPGLREKFVSVDDTTNSYREFGWSSAGADGGGTSATAVATVAGIPRRYIAHTTTASVGAQAGRAFGGVGSTQVELRTLRVFQISFRLPTALSALRLAVGMGAQPQNVVYGNTAPSNNQLGLRYDPLASDTAWKLSSKDTSTALVEALTVSPTFTAGDWWEITFSVEPPGASVQVWGRVNSGRWQLLMTRTTSLPQPTAGLLFHAGIEAREPVSKNFGINYARMLAA